MLRRATQHKRDGDLNAAIDALREAYARSKQESTIRGIDTYLRLPMYLQKAGKPDAAWKEFIKLLESGYPNHLDDPAVRPMNNSKVYDKMRLFLQREGREQEAVYYGILSMNSWAKGLLRQGRTSEHQEYAAKATVESRVGKLLRKAGAEDKLSAVSKIALEAAEDPEQLYTEAMKKRLGNILHFN